MGNIIDGVYNFVKDAVRCSMSPSGLQQLKQLIAFLKQAETAKLPREEIIDKISNATPELQSAADCLPQTRLELYAVIVIIITLLTSLVANLPKLWEATPQPTPQVIEQHIHNTIEFIYREDD